MNDYPYIILDETEKDIILSLSRKITADPSESVELFCKEAKELSVHIPNRIKIALANFAQHGSETGFFLIKYEIDENIPKTPLDNKQKIGETTTMSRIQSIFISSMSEMLAYEAEGYGRLFQDVIPTESMAKNQTSLGSDMELEIHTEQAFSKLRPDIVSLACLRGDQNAQTYILPVKYIINNITHDELKMLREPLWKTGVDLSFKMNGASFIDGDIRGPIPIISGEKEDPRLIFDQDLMIGETQESENMIKKIVDIYYKHRIVHNLQSGEIIFIDNRRAVHGRSSFTPKYDGYDRFLIRCFSVFNYEDSAYARSNNGRMVSAIYS